MKVLVTGGAGYVGSVVARTLIAQGHEVRILDSLLHGGRALLGLCLDERCSFIRGDMRSDSVVKTALQGMEAVVHLAAIVGDPACAREPALARAVNLEASLQLFGLSQRQGVQRFIFASTCSNYGKMSEASGYLTEDAALHPLSLYAETKVAVERALLAASGAAGPVVSLLRFATVFGLSPRMRFDLTVNEFTRDLMTKGKVTVYGEHFWRPYLHVRDAARAVCLVLESPAASIQGHAFNVGDTSQNYQKGQLLDLICAQMVRQVEIERVPQKDDPRDYRVSFDKIQRTLKFQITRTVTDGVREIIAAIDNGVLTDCDDPSYRN